MSVLTDLLKGEGNELNNVDLGQAFLKKFTIDATKVTIASGDVLKLMVIPIGTYIEGAVLNVITAEGSALTINLGDYTIATDVAIDADNFLAAVDCNTVAQTHDAAPTSTSFYSAKTAYLGAAFSAAVTAAKVEVFVYGRRLNK